MNSWIFDFYVKVSLTQKLTSFSEVNTLDCIIRLYCSLHVNNYSATMQPNVIGVNFWVKRVLTFENTVHKSNSVTVMRLIHAFFRNQCFPNSNRDNYLFNYNFLLNINTSVSKKRRIFDLTIKPTCEFKLDVIATYDTLLQ